MEVDTSAARRTQGLDPVSVGKVGRKAETNRFLFDLADGWALGADEKQWIILRRRNFRTQQGWKPIAFVATTKAVLRRVLNENGVPATPDAQGKLNQLPECFADWQSQFYNGSSAL